MAVFRIDKISTKGKVKKTDEGYLRGDAVITRTGVFTYRNPDGSVASRELRHPDDVLKSDSIESLKMRPITNLHPSVKVDAKNAKRLQIGMTGETVKHDGKNIIASVLITDQDAINAIEAGRQELSAGYFCDVVKEDGIYNGERYDSRQMNVKYNHVAICEKGRAGAEARLNFDSLDSVIDTDILENEFNEDGGPGSGRRPEGGSDDDENEKSKVALYDFHNENRPHRQATSFDEVKAAIAKGYSVHYKYGTSSMQEVNKDPKRFGEPGIMGMSLEKVEKHMPHLLKDLTINIRKVDSLTNEEVSMLKLKIDSCEYDVPQEVKAYTDKLVSENATLKGKCDAFEGRDIQKEISEGVKARRNLEVLATPVLKDVKLDGLTDEEIKKQVITKVLPDMKLDGASADYLNGCFEVACRSFDKVTKDNATYHQRSQSTLVRKDADNNDLISASSARDRMIARTQNFGKDVK